MHTFKYISLMERDGKGRTSGRKPPSGAQGKPDGGEEPGGEPPGHVVATAVESPTEIGEEYPTGDSKLTSSDLELAECRYVDVSS